jgi:hypothetical protein
MPNSNPDHQKYRCNNSGELSNAIQKELLDQTGLLKYLYLFAFDLNDILFWSSFIAPEPHSYDLSLSMAADIFDRHHDNIYFIIKAKSYQNFIEASADMAGTMKMAENFKDSWRNFQDKSDLANPALKRFIVEFINLNLELPLRYSLQQRLADEKELSQAGHPHLKNLQTSIWPDVPDSNRSQKLSWWHKLIRK